MNIDYQSLFLKFLTAFSYAIGIAAAKALCVVIPLQGFNLNF